MDYKLNVGDKIPDFECKDQNGNLIKSIGLVGAPLVIYFYPKDATPTCTTEACGFRDLQPQMEKLGYRVVGISPDGILSHQNFIQQHNLNFTLLCDENLELCKKFDVLRFKEDRSSPKVERTTFVVDSEGVIRWLERPVLIDGHIERVMHNIAKVVKAV